MIFAKLGAFMSIAILLRNQQTPNIFRDLLLNAVQLPDIKEIIICSGFFQNNFNKSVYCASTEGNLAQKLAASNAEVITVGIHNAQWKFSFDDFNNSLTTAGVNLAVRKVSGYKWHAKVFIASTKNGPVFSLVGSSNMTRNAFSTSTPFNYEADVALWIPQAKGVSSAVNGVLSESSPSNIIRTSYSPNKNGGLTIRERLTQLRNDILRTTEPS